MNLSIIGAGYGRTGTMSLKHALEILGLGPCYHMQEVLMRPKHLQQWCEISSTGCATSRQTFVRLFEGFQSTLDWPSTSYWRNLLAHNPKSKVILTVRDADAWYLSMRNTIHSVYQRLLHKEDSYSRMVAQILGQLVFQREFAGQFENKSKMLVKFEAHKQEVIARVPKEQLLVYDVREGWLSLCEFLACNVPDVPFPNVNSEEKFIRDYCF